MISLLQNTIADLDNICQVLANLRQELLTDTCFSSEQSEHWIVALGGTRLRRR